MSNEVTNKALARLANAIENGTGCRFSAIEVQHFNAETLGGWAFQARDDLKKKTPM